MIYSFDSDMADRYGINAAIVFNTIKVAISHLRQNDAFDYKTDINSFCFIHKFLPKKSVIDALLKLEKCGVIYLGWDVTKGGLKDMNYENGGFNVSLPRHLY